MSDKTTIEEITVPANVFVPCPKEGLWDNVSVMRECVERCPHFCGLYGLDVVGPAEKIAAMKFVERYRLNCAHPRGMEMLEVKL